MSDQQSEVLKTRLKGSWVAKMAVFFLVLLGLAGWGYLDASIVYPARGRDVIEFTKMNYLTVAQSENMLFRASVEDPAAEHARLIAAEPETLTVLERSRKDWLTAVSRLYSLDKITTVNTAEMQRRVADPSIVPTAVDSLSETGSGQTMFENSTETLSVLSTKWSNRDLPNKLSSLDLPVQWMICFTGLAGALWVGFLFLKAKATSFSYKPETHELTLSNGKSFTPEMIEVVDKRKWDKFFVFLKVQGFDGEIKLDLLKFVPLEEWVLEMEKLSPNYEPEEESGEDGSADDDAAVGDEASAEHAESA